MKRRFKKLYYLKDAIYAIDHEGDAWRADERLGWVPVKNPPDIEEQYAPEHPPYTFMMLVVGLCAVGAFSVGRFVIEAVVAFWATR